MNRIVRSADSSRKPHHRLALRSNRPRLEKWMAGRAVIRDARELDALQPVELDRLRRRGRCPDSVTRAAA